MVQLNTPKKLDKQAVKDAAYLLASELASWQADEVERLLQNPKNKSTYIIEIKNGYRVGKIYVKENDGMWEVSNTSRCTDAVFFSKKRALWYAILLHNKKDDLASEMRDVDRLIEKYKADIEFYKHTIKVSNKKQNYERAEHSWNRLDNALFQLNTTNLRLEKTLRSAKYIKLWDIKS